MNQEIERKFLIERMPDLWDITCISYERYFLENNENHEIRIQKKWGKYEYEEKSSLNMLSAKKIKRQISREEFENLKKKCTNKILRDSYKISRHPDISIKIYHWIFEWLSRVEVEFDTLKNAENFSPLSWFWEEITDSPLWRDSRLIKLSQEKFQELINS